MCNDVISYNARNEWFFILNKVLYKCVFCHYKTLLSLSNCDVEQATPFGCREAHFLRDKYEQHCTAVYMYIYPEKKKKKKKSAVKKKRERNRAGEWLLCANSDKLYICTHVRKKNILI